MTLMERMSNPVLKSTKLSKLLNMTRTDHHQAAPLDDLSKTDHERIAANTVRSLSFGDHVSARRMTKAIAAVDAQSASVIGIVGARRRVGASVTSRHLAGAFASFGRKTLLVDASQINFGPSSADDAMATAPPLWESAIEVRPFLSLVDLSTLDNLPISSPNALQQALENGTRPKQTIVVDLPPIMRASGMPNAAVSTLGNACDLIFLVCLSGDMRRSELSECVETCKVIGLKLDGMILNDWQLPASSLLES